MRRYSSGLLVLVCLWLCVATPAAQEGSSERLGNEIQKRLRRLTNYGAFDWLTYELDGVDVRLYGFATRPSVSKQAVRTLKGIRGIETVSDTVEILPASSSDQRIRSGVYVSIYNHPALQRRYSPAGGTRRLSPGELRQARTFGLESTNFARGPHAIHIIVKNGHVILLGSVTSQSDSQLAERQAKQVFGVFTVANQLTVP